jgi:hypothetical protein
VVNYKEKYLKNYINFIKEREMEIDDVVETIDKFARLLNDIVNAYDSYHDEQNQLNDATQDLLHEIELSNFNSVEGYKLSKRLKDIRNRRRVVKNNLEILQLFKDFSDKNKSTPIILFKLVTAMKTLREEQSERIYHPRVLKDIKLAEGIEKEIS